METDNIVFSPLGRYAIQVSRKEEQPDEKLLGWLIAVKGNIEKNKCKEIVEVVITYNTLLIKYVDLIKNFDKEVSDLQSLIASLQPSVRRRKWLFYLPVCYDQSFGVDIADIAAETKVDPLMIPKLHSTPLYRVCFLGFLPGFPYLGGLPEKLFCPRRKVPRKRIQQGAVGIGGSQTGIYPAASPGGWRIIGNCPVRIFDPAMDPPSPFSPGDRIRFTPVSLEEHRKITEKVNGGRFQLKRESYADEGN